MAPRVPKVELTGLAGSMIKRFSRKRLGDVPETFEVMWHNRKVIKDNMVFSRKVNKWDTVDLSLKTFAHMAVAAQVGCSWCLDAGYFHANNENLDMVKASQVPRWRESEVFTPLERAVMAYAEAMTNTPPTVTDELSARLLDLLGPAAMIELTAFIAASNAGTRSNVALGVKSQGLSDACEVPLAARPASAGVVSTR